MLDDCAASDAPVRGKERFLCRVLSLRSILQKKAAQRVHHSAVVVEQARDVHSGCLALGGTHSARPHRDTNAPRVLPLITTRLPLNMRAREIEKLAAPEGRAS